MTYIEAAIAVLKSVGQSLTIADITDRALSNGSLMTSGRTPAATMSVALYPEVKRTPTGRLTRVSQPGILRSRRGTVRFEVTT